jgi:hypothetical protein
VCCMIHIHFKGKDGSNNGECHDYGAAYLVKTVHVIIPEDFVCWILWTYRSFIFCLSLCKEHLLAVVCLTHWQHLPHSRDVCSISEISFCNLSRIYSINCCICTINETSSIPDFSSTNTEISIAGLILIIILILYYLPIIIWFFNRAYSVMTCRQK